ncbi:MAG: hypothetical protein RIR26_2803 [Pseudomonadota bacterium]
MTSGGQIFLAKTQRDKYAAPGLLAACVLLAPRFLNSLSMT